MPGQVSWVDNTTGPGIYLLFDFRTVSGDAVYGIIAILNVSSISEGQLIL